MFTQPFFLGLVVFTALGWAQVGCSNQGDLPRMKETSADDKDESIVPSSSRSPNPKVQNGDVFDKAMIKINDLKTLIVPEDATVERTGADGAIVLFLKKTQSFGGHPPEPMILEGVRKHMGCATKIENGKLSLATYGEFSTKEGGAKMKLLVRIPAGLVVETQPGLSGPKSAAQGSSEDHEKVVDGKKGYWYGPSQAGRDWKAISTEPDPKRTAK